MIILLSIALILGVLIVDSRKRGFTLSLLRTVSLSALVLGLLMPTYNVEDQRQKVTLLVDTSNSMPEGFAAQALNFLSDQKLSYDTKIEFAQEASTEVDFLKPNQEQTNIEEALKAVPADTGAILLISDGFETKGNAMQQQTTPIFPIVPSIASTEPATFRISMVDAPLQVAEGTAPPLRIVISNGTSNPTSGVVIIQQDGVEISKNNINVAALSDEIITTELKAMKASASMVTVTLQNLRDASTVDEVTHFISPTPKRKLLLVESGQEQSQLLSALSMGITLERVTPRGLTTTLLSKSNGVILNNVSALELTSNVIDEVAPWVRNGGRLLMLGGNKSFGLGGFKGTALEPILPVVIVAPEKEEKRLNIAIQLVLDKSQSMKEQNRLESAKEAALQVIRGLKDDDYVGVTGFDREPFPAIPLTQLRNNRETIVSSPTFRSLRAFGKTDLLPALNLARESLEKVQTGRKHMIVLTDGELPYGGPTYLEMVKQMRFSGITLSTVLIGPEFDGLLRQMAQVGGGAFYNTNDPSILPKIFLRDIFVRAGEKNLAEKEEYRVMAGPSGIKTTSLRAFPTLLGYTKTKVKPSASTELLVKGSIDEAPLLAREQIGSGESFAFTSDVSGRWTKPWIPWTQTATFFEEILKSLDDSSTERQQLDFRYFLEGNSLRLEVVVVQGNLPSGTVLSVTAPDTSTTEAVLTMVALGRYEATVSGMPGIYEITIGETGQKVKFLLAPSLFGERKGKGINTRFLARLAAESQGRINPTPSMIEAVKRPKIKQISLLSTWVGIALLFWIIELLIRGTSPRRRFANS